jgi:hypothetical protein
MPKEKIEQVEVKNVNDGTKNSYRVPKKQWAKWSEQARSVFNTVYSAMVANQDLFMHPKAKKLAIEHWNTPSWNAAWTAADAVDAYKAKE